MSKYNELLFHPKIRKEVTTISTYEGEIYEWSFIRKHPYLLCLQGLVRYRSCSFKVQSHIDSETRYWHLPLES